MKRMDARLRRLEELAGMKVDEEQLFWQAVQETIAATMVHPIPFPDKDTPAPLPDDVSPSPTGGGDCK